VSAASCVHIDKVGKVIYRDVGFPAEGKTQMEKKIKQLLGMASPANNIKRVK